MLADNMKELRLAGERFIKVEDWQTDPIPKRVNFKRGTTVFSRLASGGHTSTQDYKNVEVIGKHFLDSYDIETYVVSGVDGYFEPNHTYLGNYIDVPVKSCTPVTDAIGGVISALFAKLTNLLSREVVAC